MLETGVTPLNLSDQKESIGAPEMPVMMENVMRLLCFISEEKKMKAAVPHLKSHIVVISTGAFVGGWAGGPFGIFVGAAVGGILGTWLTSGQYKPVSEILKKLSSDEQQKLFNKVKAMDWNLEFMNIGQLYILVMVSEALQQRLLALLEDYLTKELYAEVQYGD